MSSESSEDLSSEDESEVEPKKKSGKKRRDVAKDESSKESKSKEKPVTKSDCNVQSNIEDLTECFKHLELKLGKRSNRKFPLQRPRSSLYCIMCRKSGHLVQECDDLQFLIAQGICMMDLNNHVVMSDRLALPC